MRFFRSVPGPVPVSLVVAALLASGCQRRSASDAAGGSTFEGTVQMTIPGSPELPVTFEMKGGKVRWSLPGAAAEFASYRLYDPAARRLFTVLPKEGASTFDDLPPPADGESEQGSDRSASKNVSGSRWTFTPLADAKGQVAGFPCTRSRVTDGAKTYEICAAKGFPALLLEYALPTVASNVPFLAELEVRGEGPLAVVRKNTGDAGMAQVPMQPVLLTIEVRPAKIDDARFEVPKGPMTPGHVSVQRALRH
jgi:hypothetical protein